MRIAFAGTPDFAVPPLAALLRSSHALVGVLTQPDRPAGRGQKLAHGPVKQYALAHGLEVAQPQTLRSAEGRAALLAWQPELLVVVAYGLILPPEALAIPARGCVNIHASLLPRWRGAAPIQRALLAGDAETGVAIMMMEAGLDTGPVLLERRVRIGARSTAGSLHDVLATLGAGALLDALAQVEAGTARPVPQGAQGVSYAAKIDKAEARIDWTRSAAEIDRQVRAFDPWPVAETRLGGEGLRIHSAQPLDAADAAAAARAAAALAGAAPVVQGAAGAGALAIGTAVPPGFVLGLQGDAVVVACGSGWLGITRLQRAGRRAVSAREFANGVELAGQVLG
ncbi:MAG: methionyl-tRNA formyltransferase [Steroidobacteraceae bacterium]